MPDVSLKRLLPRWWRRARTRARQRQAARQLAASPDFDAAFYLAQAPDVAANPRWSAQPALHYLLYGGSEGRRPSERFDSRWYLAQYPDVQAAGMNPLLHFLRHGYGEGRLPRALRAMTWHERLWSAATPEEQARARQELERLLARAEELDQEASAAAWSLGRWYAWLEQWRDAARVMAQFRRIVRPLPGHLAPHLLDLDALIRIGALTDAQARLDALLERFPNHPDLCLVASNLLGAQARAQGQPAPMPAQLAWINRPYLAQGLQTLHERPDPHGMRGPDVLEREPGPAPERAPETEIGLSIDRLQTQASPTPPSQHRAKHRFKRRFKHRPRHQRETQARLNKRWPRWFGQSTNDRALPEREQPLVSVIVPAWNAAATLPTALESLAQQTWEALEVIVVDDCSSDGTDAVVERFAQRDRRFRLLRLPSNQGAYVARNSGLAAARGDFITTHDSDDWSHPQKIERQLQPLLASDALMATVSHWVRASSDLHFGQWSTHESWMGWVHRNVSSLLFRRSIFEQLGYWDRVKVSADTEYYYRLIKAFGAECIAEVLPGIPLSFARHRPTSLTQHAETSVRSVFSGARKAYQDAAYRWHAQASGPADLYLPAYPPTRPFPAPPALCHAAAVSANAAEETRDAANSRREVATQQHAVPLPRTLFFVHIPKTAGTSFRKTCEQAFGDSAVQRDYGRKQPQTTQPIRDWVYDTPDFFELARELTTLDCRLLCGHVPLARFVALVGLLNSVTFVRHPVERVLSHFQHCCRHNGYTGSLEAFIELPGNQNLQSRLLANAPVEALGFAGVTERYEESLALLNETFGLRLRALTMNCHPERIDRTDYPLNAETRQRILALNRSDADLLQRANHLLDARRAAFSAGQTFVHGALQSVTAQAVSGFAFMRGCTAPVMI